MEQLLRARVQGAHRGARLGQDEIPVDDHQARRRQGRPGDPAGDQRRHPAGRGRLVHARQRRQVLPDGRLAESQPLPAGRQDRQGVDLAGRRVQLHAVQQRPVRAADADRRLRPLLQHRPAQEEGLQLAPEDPLRAGRHGQEADRVQPRRQHQGGRLHAADGLLQRQHGQHLRPRLRCQVVRRRRQADPARRPPVGQDAAVAEDAGRRDRLRQAAEVRRQAGRRRLRVVLVARLRARQDRDDDRR